MSDITYDWVPFEAQAATELPTRQMVGASKPYRREDEFRSALDRYLAGYRRNRELIADKAAHQMPKNRTPLGRRTAGMLWFQPWF